MEPKVETAEFLALPSLSEERRAAARDAWAAFWSSRAVVWAAGMIAVLAFGWASDTSARLDPQFTTLPFTDEFANLLVAPAARFDSAWYLAIAQHGYEVGGRSAFFPVFPGLVRIGGELLGSALIAGITISIVSGLGALYLLHRLAALDFGLCVEASRRLNPAYTAYAACGLALPLSVPAEGFPLMSLPRFELVIFGSPSPSGPTSSSASSTSSGCSGRCSPCSARCSRSGP
jgi:hypothetical protein